MYLVFLNAQPSFSFRTLTLISQNGTKSSGYGVWTSARQLNTNFKPEGGWYWDGGDKDSHLPSLEFSADGAQWASGQPNDAAERRPRCGKAVLRTTNATQSGLWDAKCYGMVAAMACEYRTLVFTSTYFT